MPTSPTEFRLAITQVPPRLSDEIVPAAHLIHLAGEIEREHDLAAAALGVPVDDAS